MKRLKKSVCLVLSLLLLMSVCVVPSLAVDGALPSGQESATEVNVKFEVEQVASAYDGMLTAVDNNIYAVTIYAKSAQGINTLQVPVHFDQTKFSPIMWADDDPVNNGALGYDGWYTDMQDENVYDFVNGQAWNETEMLRSNGQVATSVGPAQYIPLGNENASPMANAVRYVDSTTPGAAAWYNGLPENTGVMYYFFLCAVNKNAYLNAYKNAIVNDWVSVCTMYFLRNPGVSEEEAAGSVFGYTVENAYGYEYNVDTTENARYTTTAPLAKPGMNFVSNAVVEAAGPVVAKSRSQVKMTATSDTTVADAFTFRVISTITDADWDAYFANTAAGGDTDAIQRLGFVAYKGTDGFDMETAKAVAQGSATEGYEVAWTDYVQKADDSSDAYFGARLEITSAETRADVTYVGVVEYLNADGTTAYAFYDAAEQALLNTNYDTIVADYLATYPYAG